MQKDRKTSSSWRARLCAVLLGPALTACSPGLGDLWAPEPPSIFGSVAPGAVAAAEVTAWCHDWTPAVFVGTATTRADGRFVIDTSQACTAGLELRVRGGRFTDLATGAERRGPEVDWLHAQLPSLNTSERVVVSPVTEAIHRAVKSSGSQPPTAAALAQATARVRQRLDELLTQPFDPLRQPPAEFSSSRADGPAAYALLMAAGAWLEAQGRAQTVPGWLLPGTDDVTLREELRRALAEVAVRGDVLARAAVEPQVALQLLR